MLLNSVMNWNSITGYSYVLEGEYTGLGKTKANHESGVEGHMLTQLNYCADSYLPTTTATLHPQLRQNTQMMSYA